MIRVQTVAVPAGRIADAATRIHRYWRHRPHTFWLDSACDPDRLGRFSFLGTDPYTTIHSSSTTDLLQLPTELTDPIFGLRLPDDYPAPFAGGLVGYVAYDAVRPAEDERNGDEVRLPDFAFGAYDAIVAIDHQTDRLYVVSTGLPLTGREAERRAAERLAWLSGEVERALRMDGMAPCAEGGDEAGDDRAAGDVRAVLGIEGEALHSNFTRAEYTRAVQELLDRIDAGDVEQVNLSQQFTMATQLSGPELYDRLRKTNAAPYGALLQWGDGWILSSSPERFLHIRGDYIEMRPIKGTRPRGKDAAEDAAFREALLASGKDAAEHDMIVAMTEDELASVCEAGSVHVAEHKVCEQYATVFHLVSTVAGRLAEGTDRLEVVRKLFPAGSITGRPKARAMEIIEELETVPRGVYTGAIGYIGAGGNVDFNVAIRTIVLQGGQGRFHVGGAVVAQSDPEGEYDETLDKAEGMLRALRGTGGQGSHRRGKASRARRVGRGN